MAFRRPYKTKKEQLIPNAYWMISSTSVDMLSDPGFKEEWFV